MKHRAVRERSSHSKMESRKAVSSNMDVFATITENLQKWKILLYAYKTTTNGVKCLEKKEVVSAQFRYFSCF